MAEAIDQSPETNTETVLPSFDPSRLVSIMRRKVLIKDLAAAYHAKCLACCQELLELQRKWEEVKLYSQPTSGNKTLEEMRKEMLRQPKRMKKTR